MSSFENAFEATYAALTAAELARRNNQEITGFNPVPTDLSNLSTFEAEFKAVYPTEETAQNDTEFTALERVPIDKDLRPLYNFYHYFVNDKYIKKLINENGYVVLGEIQEDVCSKYYPDKKEGQGAVPNIGGVYSGYDFVSTFSDHPDVLQEEAEAKAEAEAEAGKDTQSQPAVVDQDKGKTVETTVNTAGSVEMKSILEDDEGLTITKVVNKEPVVNTQQKTMSDHFKSFARK